MGYRSDIAYVIAFSSDAELASFLAQAKSLSGQSMNADDAQQILIHRFHNIGPRSDAWGDMNLALNECGICWQKDLHQTPYIGFFQEHVKWYEGLQQVEAHESLINLAIANFHQGGEEQEYLHGTTFTCTKIALDYLRLGEDEDDTTRFDWGRSMMLGSFGEERKIWRTIAFRRATGGGDE